MYEKYVLEITGAENAEKSEIIEVEAESNEPIETIGAISAPAEEQSVAEESETTSEYMTVFPKSGFENIPENATMMDRLAYGGKITLIGMTTVFMVLVLIWALCALMGKVFGNVGKEEKKSAPPVSPAPQQPVAPAVKQPEPVACVDYSKIAVVASAAIAAYRGEDTVNFNISSIRPCVNGAVALAPEVVAQIAASIACLEGKDTVDFTISSIRIV